MKMNSTFVDEKTKGPAEDEGAQDRSLRGRQCCFRLAISTTASAMEVLVAQNDKLVAVLFALPGEEVSVRGVFSTS
jgi:hypothetical protein